MPAPMNSNSSRSNRSVVRWPSRPRNVKYSVPLPCVGSKGMVMSSKVCQLAVGISVAVPITGASTAPIRTSTTPPSKPAE